MSIEQACRVVLGNKLAEEIMEGQHCCLGVLARLAGYSDEDIDGRGTLGGFPKALAFVGLRGTLGGFRRSTEYLADHNDSGVPFSEIADIIEREPAGLFVASPAKPEVAP